MRGALPVDRELQELPGIIPADAGSTRYDMVSSAIPEDHPRGCGEHLISS